MWHRQSGQRTQVQQLLTETIRTLCKNTLAVIGDVTVEGLLGITVNNCEVILVNINELVQCKNQEPHSSGEGLNDCDTPPHPLTNFTNFNSSVSHRERALTGRGSYDRPSEHYDNYSNPAISSSSRVNPEKRQSNVEESVESKKRRWPDSNEAAPSADNVQHHHHPPGGDVENEEEALVVSPIEDGEGSEIKNEEFSSIAVVHYHSFKQESKRAQQKDSNLNREETKGSGACGKYHEDEEEQIDENYNERYHEQTYEHDDEQDDDQSYDDMEITSVTSDTSLTSDPSRVTNTAGPSKQESPTYVCSFCSKTFKYKSNLKKHCFEKHNIQHLYKCPYCEQFVVNRRLYREHVLTHEENRPFKCGICGRMFQTQSDLKRHLVTPNVHRNSLPRLTQL